MDLNQKGAMIKMLESLLNSGWNAQIRDAIRKFRQNRKTVDIQRNFLKRLLTSKAGMVVLAFRKIQTLPEKKNMETYGRASKFERGLSAFVERITKRAFDGFKNTYDDGQAMKKRSVLQLINVTHGGQKKLYNRWVSITERTKLMNECKEVSSVFASLNNVVKSVSDNAFLGRD